MLALPALALTHTHTHENPAGRTSCMHACVPEHRLTPCILTCCYRRYCHHACTQLLQGHLRHRRRVLRSRLPGAVRQVRAGGGAWAAQDADGGGGPGGHAVTEAVAGDGWEAVWACVDDSGCCGIYRHTSRISPEHEWSGCCGTYGHTLAQSMSGPDMYRTSP